MNVALPTRMTVAEFLTWSSRQERGRYELQDGRVIMQQSQNWAHLRVKGNIFVLLRQAIAANGLPFYATTDGATVRITSNTAFEPDALVAPLPPPADSELEIANPVIVVEVLSPNSIKRDLTDKVAGYFQVASILHYLVVDPEEELVICHRRSDGGGVHVPQVLRSGTLMLDPPAVSIELAAIFA